jgi:hypothetical protein
MKYLDFKLEKQNFRLETSFFNKDFILEIEFLESFDYYILHIYDREQKPIVLGLKLQEDWPLFRYQNIEFFYTKNKLVAYEVI